MFEQRDSYKFSKNGVEYEVFVSMSKITFPDGQKAGVGDYVVRCGDSIEVIAQQRFLNLYGIFAKNAGMPDELLGKPLNFGTPNDPRNLKL